MNFRTRFTERVRVTANTTGPTRTKQAFKDQCDINNILKRYEKTGVLPVADNGTGKYGDFSEVVDYQGALNQVIAAQSAFGGLSAKIRARFSNDPAEFLKFAEDPKNEDALVEMGLATRRAKPTEPEPSAQVPPVAEPPKV